MVLDESITKEVIHEIGLLFEADYEFLTNKSFDVFILNNINDLKKELSTMIKVEKTFITSIINNHKKSKKRVYEKIKSELDLIDNNNCEKKLTFSLAKDVELVYKVFTSCTSENDIEKFKSFYEVSDYESYKDKILKKIYTWAYDKEAYFCSELDYIKDYSLKKIEKYIEKDIRIAFYKYIANRKTNKMMMLTKTLSEIPVDHTNKRKIFNTFGNNVLQDIYVIDDEKEFETIVDFSKVDNEILKESVSKVFNLVDRKVIQYLISVSDEDFFSTRKVSCHLGEIVEYIFPGRSNKSYLTVKNSILKINLYKCIIIDKKIRQSPYSIFEASVTKALNSDKEIVSATFSESFVNDLIKNGPISVYDDIVNGYKMNISQILVYALQRERYALINENKEPLTKTLTYKFFQSVLYLANVNKSSNIKLILGSLTEIKESGIVLKDFFRKRDLFTLEFYPIDLKEKNDLAQLIQSYSIKITTPCLIND